MTQVRQIRERKGVTQQELAATAGLALSTVVEIEAGRTQPRIPTAKAIAAALGTTLDELWPMQSAATARTTQV